MSSAIRLYNGGTIQVRTGVLAGLGPQGPRGVAGAKGDKGDTGSTGPMGTINSASTRLVCSVGVTVPANNGTPVVVPFDTAAYDDLSARTSDTVITFVSAGDYLVSGWVLWGTTTNASGHRTIKFATTDGVTLYGGDTRTSPSASTAIQYQNFCFSVRVNANTAVNLKAQQGSPSAHQIQLGALTINKIGVTS